MLKAEKDEEAVFFFYWKIRKVTEKENHSHEEEKRKGAADKESKEISECSLFKGWINVNGLVEWVMERWCFEEECAEPESQRRYCQTRTVPMN